MNKKRNILDNIKGVIFILLFITFIVLLSGFDVDSTTPTSMIEDAQQQAQININSKK